MTKPNKRIVGEALTAARAVAILGASIPLRYFRTFKWSSISGKGGCVSLRTELISSWHHPRGMLVYITNVNRGFFAL